MLIVSLILIVEFELNLVLLLESSINVIGSSSQIVSAHY